jgi:hypothetical protein
VNKKRLKSNLSLFFLIYSFMRKYYEFLVEKQIESINESIVYFSPKLREELAKVKHPIAKDILSKEGTNPKEDVTFLDVDWREGYVTFKTMKSMLKGIEEEAPIEELKPMLKRVEDEFIKAYSDEYLVNLPSWNKSRNPVKVGKIVNILSPGKWTPGDIEKFTDKFKAVQKGETSMAIKVVEGDEIAFWYNEKNYLNDGSTLGSSCMRYEKCENYFDIYTKNPEVCKMVCLLDEDENNQPKLRARALLWKVDSIRTWNGNPKFEWFMDRQYAISDADVEYLREWANREGYAYKSSNSFGGFTGVTFNEGNFKINMAVQLKDEGYRLFPYVDTFRRFNPDEAKLYNDEDQNYAGDYLLNSTSGGYEEITGVWSEWLGDTIPEDESVWSDHVDSYLYESDAVYISKGSRMHQGWWPQNHDNIVFDEWYQDSIHINDAYYSEHYGGYILGDETVDVVDYVEKDGNCNEEPCWVHENDSCYLRFNNSNIKNTFWYNHLSEKRNSNWEDHYGILNNLLVKDWKDEWILKEFKIELYEIVGDNPYSDLEYCETGAALVLGLELGKDEQVWDGLEYFNLLLMEVGFEELEKLATEKRNSFEVSTDGDSKLNYGKSLRCSKFMNELNRYATIL